MSSADARVDERVDFEVLEDVKVHDVVVIPRGGIAWATVTEAQPKRRLGRGGKLQMNIDAVKLVNGDKVSLRAVKDVKGGGKTGAMTAGLVVTGLLFWPAAPFFLFMKGKDITVPKGTEITAYTHGDIPLDEAAFMAAAPPTQTYTVDSFGSPGEGSHTTEVATTEVAISSVPEGADIEIDGSLMGNAPSTVRLSAGEHSIAIKKSGYKVWERKIRTSGGSIKVNAELERVEAPAEPK